MADEKDFVEEINSKTILSEKVKEAKNQIYHLISERIGEAINFAKNTNEKLFKSIEMERKPDSDLMKLSQLIKSLLPEKYKSVVEAFINLQ